jgi:Predicted AAA-ATPase
VPRPLPIGVDDFRALRERGMEYVDKSHLVREVLDLGAEVLLLPRPRRFGKTLNMTMLRCFFEKRAEDLSPLFSDLSIWQAGDAYRAHFQRYPVVYLTLKGVHFESFDLAWDMIKKRLSGLFEEHRALLDGGVLSDEEALRYRQVLDGTASFSAFGDALLDLSTYLHRAHGERGRGRSGIGGTRASCPPRGRGRWLRSRWRSMGKR